MDVKELKQKCLLSFCDHLQTWITRSEYEKGIPEEERARRDVLQLVRAIRATLLAGAIPGLALFDKLDNLIRLPGRLTGNLGITYSTGPWAVRYGIARAFRAMTVYTLPLREGDKFLWNFSDGITELIIKNFDANHYGYTFLVEPQEGPCLPWTSDVSSSRVTSVADHRPGDEMWLYPFFMRWPQNDLDRLGHVADCLRRQQAWSKETQNDY